MGKKFTTEFKQEAVKLVTVHGYSQAEVGRSLGVSDKNINRWVNETKIPDSVKHGVLTASEEELKFLRKEIERLKMEKEILKKAAAFFASEKD